MPRGIYKRKPIIKTGDKYNRLTAIRFHHRDKWKTHHWLFRCDCGNEKVIKVSRVKSGDTKSCGCLAIELIKKRDRLRASHRMSNTKTYNSWDAMKQRCLNKNHKYYKYYGGRGITVCDRWLKFENFYEDMGKRQEGMTLDRIKNNLGYYKENCRWATWKEQSNNKRSNHLLTFNGKTQNIAQWAEELGISWMAIYSRIRYGWSIEKILSSKNYLGSNQFTINIKED